MRILLGIILFTAGMLGFARPVSAMGFEIDEITFRTALLKNGALSSIYELRTQFQADWFQLQTAAKIYGSGSNYFAFTNDLTVEKYLKNLKLDFGAVESADYRFVGFDADFQRKILENWRLNLDYAVEDRMPKGAKGSFYHDDSEQIELKYQGGPFQYSIRFHRQAKDYPTNSQYTSLKYTLENTLEWQPCPALGFDLTYQEDSGAYPARIAQNYWKDKWSFGGRWNLSKSWMLDLDCSTQEWFKGFFPYRRDYWYQSELQIKPNAVSKWSLSASLHGLAYCDTGYPLLEPGEWLTDETKSRLEEKVNLEYCLRRGIFTWCLGYFIERADFQSAAVADKQDTGFYSSLDWNFKQTNLKVSMTPGGSIGNRYSRYQLIIGYKPK